MAGKTKDQLRAIGKIGGEHSNGKSKSNTIRLAEGVIEQIKKKQLVNPSKVALDIGYSRSTVEKNISTITKRPEYLRVLNNFLDSLKEKRAMSLANITEKKLKKSSARDLAQITDTLSKNVNLIEGKPTDITANMGAFLYKIEQEATKDKDLSK